MTTGGGGGVVVVRFNIEAVLALGCILFALVCHGR